MPNTLRRIVDIVAVTAACGLFAGVGWFAWAEYQHHHNVKKLSSELRRFDSVLALQSATGKAESTSRGWPLTVDPSWFGGDPPRNPFLTPHRPWVEVAPREHATLSNPPVPIAFDSSFAEFWYNPYRGVIRARVPLQISDARTLELYNTVNGTSLSSLHTEQVPVVIEPTEAVEPSETASAPDDNH